MKDKRYKYIDDAIEDYLQLQDEKKELPLMILGAKEKQISLLDDLNGGIVKKGDAEDLFKLFQQIRKNEERKIELVSELEEVEFTLREFLSFLNGSQLAYERKDDGEKHRTTYLFWLDEGAVKCNR